MSKMIFTLIETAQATSLASPTVSRKMAIVDSAPRCIFPQIVGEGSRGITRSHSGSFLPEKTLRGMGGLRRLPMKSASPSRAQACLLLLHRQKRDYFPGLLTILVYPLSYMVESKKRQIAELLWERGDHESPWRDRSVESGSLVSVLGAVKHGAADPSDGTRTFVLHEFAHQLDFENDAADGVPRCGDAGTAISLDRRDEIRVCVAPRCR